MRILVCALEAPVPPYNGLRLQLSSLVRELDRRHDVRVLAFVPPGFSRPVQGTDGMRIVDRPLQGRFGKLRLVARAMRTGRPVGVDAFVGGLRAQLIEEMRTYRPDVLHVTSGELAPVIDAIAAPPAVIAVLDSWYRARLTQVQEARGLRRRLLRHDAERVRRHEATQYSRFERVVVVSEGDRRALASLAPELRLEVIPNGVDADYYAPDPTSTPDHDRIAFHGVLEYGPNATAAHFLAERVLPLVRREVPGARLALVGRGSSARVRGLGRRAGVEVVGEVPDVRPWLTGSRVYACGILSGQGIKNKLLEAMACGVASVATSQSLGGLAVEPGRDLLVADGAEPFARAVARVLADEGLATRLGSAGREYVQAHHSWESVGRAFERVYRQAIDDRDTSGPA